MKTKKWKQIFKLGAGMILLYISPLFLIVPFVMIPFFISYPIWMPVIDWDETKPPFSGNIPNNDSEKGPNNEKK